MSTPLLNLGPNQRLDLGDLAYLSQAQPLGLTSDILGCFASPANAASKKYILHGFATRSGIAGPNSNPAANQLQISSGSGILAYRQGAGVPLYGVMASLDGSDQVAQTIDMTYQPSGAYTVFLRLTYTDSAQTDRSFWSPAGTGYEFAQLTSTRKVASFEVQALGTGSNPGDEWLPIATLQWTASGTQGGAGAIASLTDTRPLYFEGQSTSSTPFSSPWGSTNDRSADRSSYGVGDLKTFVDAVKSCLEDIKGPGLRRWWDSSLGGMNLGFGPNTPALGRLALGTSAFYLQGPIAGLAGHGYLTSAVDGAGKRTGFDFGPDRTRYILADTNIQAFSAFGTVGFGSLAEIDVTGSPGRALVEMVVSTNNQAALRLGARAVNGATPVSLDVNMSIVAPDQTGNMARILFGRGGVQGTEAALFWAGKGSDNNFYINDIAGNNNFFSFQPASKTLGFACGPFVINDLTNNVNAVAYSTATRVTSFAGNINTSGINATGTVSASVLSSTNAIIPTLSSTNVTCSTVSASGTVTAGQVNVGNSQQRSDYLLVPQGATDPAVGTTPEGALFYNTTLRRFRYRDNAGWNTI